MPAAACAASPSFWQLSVTGCGVSFKSISVTVDQKAREFQYATPGQPLLEILDDHALEIAPSRWIDWLKPGAEFDVQVDETGKTYRARVDRLGGRVDPVSQSIKVIGQIKGEQPGPMPGMSGRALLSPPR